MTDDFWSFAIGVIIGGLVVGIIAWGFPNHNTPATAWELYMEQREIADQEYARAYGRTLEN